MCQCLKTHFSFLMCFLVILMSCTNRKVSREFSDTMKDGSRVVIKIEYKPKSVMNSKGEKLGSYYFIAKHSFQNGKNAEAEPALKMQELKKNSPNIVPEIRASLKNFTPKQIRSGLQKAGYRQTDGLLLYAIPGIIYISFYDREGHLLLKGFTPDGYTYNQNFSNHEKNTVDGGMEWKGQFDERIITVENFRDIHSITAQWR